MTHELHGTDPERHEASPAAGLAQFPPGARETIEEAFTQLSVTGEPYDLELPFRTLDGQERMVRVVGRAVVRDGVVVRVHGTFEDVTDQVARRRERAELERIRALLEEAQRLARLGHWEGDLVEDDLRWSPIVQEIFGLDPDGPLPPLARLQATIHPADRDTVRVATQQLREEGAQAVDFRIVRPDGTVRHVCQLARLSGAPGEPSTRILGTVQDVTELRAIERALRDSQDQLERVLAATNDGWWDLNLAAGTSFYSERWWALCGYVPGELPDEPEPWRQCTHPDDLPRFEAAFAEILASGERTFTLPSAGLHRDGRRIPMVVRGLIARDEAGTPVRISGATSDVSEARQAAADNAPYAAMHGARFELDLPEGEVRVDVDRTRLDQVLANLLSNAAKFAPEGTAVDLRLRPSGTPGWARVEVIDRGPGVPEDLQEGVFERFVQADPSDPRSRGGTGLGLAISRDIIERHGGRIGLARSPDGTCFWFELPVVDAAP